MRVFCCVFFYYYYLCNVDSAVVADLDVVFSEDFARELLLGMSLGIRFRESLPILEDMQLL